MEKTEEKTDNTETQTRLGIRHRKMTNKTKDNTENNNGSYRDPTGTGMNSCPREGLVSPISNMILAMLGFWDLT